MTKYQKYRYFTIFRYIEKTDI